jgi:hypothetical protein
VLDASGSGDRPWIGPMGSGQLDVSVVGPLFAELGISVGAAVVRHTFAVDAMAGTNVVFAQPPVNGTAWLGLGMEIR